MLTVRELWRYPVKSMRGERLESSEVTDLGLPGDRAFGVVDVESGTVLTARREPALLFLSASWHDGDLEVRGEDGEDLTADAALSARLGRPVRLVAAGAEGGIYEDPGDAEDESEWGSWQGPGGAWHDSGRTRLSLVSTGTLTDWAFERFRSNVLLDGAGEDALVGRRVRVGSCLLEVTGRIGRCVMVTRAQPGIDVDRDVLRTIHRERDGELAIGAVIAEPGQVRVGDPLAPAD